jgi:phosphatidylglycerol:prolipoprotein diacylglycerol transferase
LNFPVYIHFGNSGVLLHSLAELLAFFAGFQYFQWLRKRKGDPVSASSRGWILVGTVFGALLGSRLIGGLEDPQQMIRAKNVFLYFYENKTVVGGFLGGLIAVEIVKNLIGEKRSSGDLFVKPILLALIIGRIGCFTMGIYEETYGLPTHLPWGMNLGDGIRRHPVALYEIIFLSLLWIFISRLERKYELRSGSSFKIFMIAYLTFRFILDFIKPHADIVFGLSVIQIVCLAGLIYYRRDIRSPKRMIHLKQMHA